MIFPAGPPSYLGKIGRPFLHSFAMLSGMNSVVLPWSFMNLDRIKMEHYCTRSS